jgi:quercetin dioxygenase-like cupin family protein
MRLEKGIPAHRAALFGGTGTVTVWSLLAASAEPFIAVLSCALEAGGSVGAHVQDEFPEIVVGLEGDGEATVDGGPLALGPGDVVHLRLGSVLTLRNRSQEAPLHYLIIKARQR